MITHMAIYWRDGGATSQQLRTEDGMKVKARVAYGDVLGMLMVLGAGAAVLSGFARYAGMDEVANLGLSVMFGAALLLLLAVFAGWAAEQPAFRVCSYCGESVPETDGYACAGERFACEDCCTRRVVVTTRKDVA
jgi:hypothetical protein